MQQQELLALSALLTVKPCRTRFAWVPWLEVTQTGVHQRTSGTPMGLMGSWADLPDVALNNILLKVGLPSLGNSLGVCQGWNRPGALDLFWRDVVCNEFGMVHTDVEMPAGISSWYQLACFLYHQKIYLIELGSSNCKQVIFESQSHCNLSGKGFLDLQMKKAMVWSSECLVPVFVFMGVTTAHELFLWPGPNSLGQIRLAYASETYIAPFKNQNVIVRIEMEAIGALVLTRAGDLFQTVAWGSIGSMQEPVFAKFEKVHFPSPSRVISFAISSAGVKAAVLENGLVFVWGELGPSLVQYLGSDAMSIFGRGHQSGHAAPEYSATFLPVPQQINFEEGPCSKNRAVQIVSGKAHFLARMENGDVWGWGIGGCSVTSGVAKISDHPIRVAGKISKLCTGYMMMSLDGNFFAYQEPVCREDDESVWNPMYNIQNKEDVEPSQPNDWPWYEESLGPICASGRNLCKMSQSSAASTLAGCVGYSQESLGCIRIHINSKRNCQTWQNPIRVVPMFDVGSNVRFSSRGSAYYSENGRIVLKDAKSAVGKYQFLLLDLGCLGLKGKLASLCKPSGGWILVTLSRN